MKRHNSVTLKKLEIVKWHSTFSSDHRSDRTDRTNVSLIPPCSRLLRSSRVLECCAQQNHSTLWSRCTYIVCIPRVLHDAQRPSRHFPISFGIPVFLDIPQKMSPRIAVADVLRTLTYMYDDKNFQHNLSVQCSITIITK